MQYRLPVFHLADVGHALRHARDGFRRICGGFGRDGREWTARRE